jgi:hypothetical protein
VQSRLQRRRAGARTLHLDPTTFWRDQTTNEKAPEGPPPSSYANVLATAALFVALGGSSYAAVEITGKDVRDGSLTGADIRNNSLTSADIKNGSLLAADFKPGQLRGASGAAAAATWTYHHDVGDGSLVSDLPAIPELAQLTITCDLAHDGTGRLYIHNTSDTTIDFVANVDTTGGAIPHRLDEVPLDLEEGTNIQFPPGVSQLTLQIFPAIASAPGPVATVTASYLGARGKCDLTASGSYQDPEHGA